MVFYIPRVIKLTEIEDMSCQCGKIIGGGTTD